MTTTHPLIDYRIFAHDNLFMSGWPSVPPGGGWRVRGRAASHAGHRAAERTNQVARSRRGRGQLGYCFVHTAVDDCSRVACSEVLDDETATTAVAFWAWANAFFAAHSVTVTEVLTDNGACYRSRHWREILTAAAITHRCTRPYRPQTNGKVERFNPHTGPRR